MTDPDRSLARRARRGDRRALMELYDRHRGALLGFLVRVTGNRAMAEDVFQEAWIKVLQGIETYRTEAATFRAWLFRVAHNSAIDHRRRDARRPADELDAPVGADLPSRAELLASQAPGPDRVGEGRIEARRLARALGELSEKQRAAVLLRHQQGLTYTEIATALAVPEGTAKTMVHRGVTRIRRRLAVPGCRPQELPE